MHKSKSTSPLTDPLRQAIVDSGLPLLRLSKGTGVARASLIRFVRGETSLRLDIADRLAEYFGLELRSVQTRKRKGG
jgi:plasmid maintenance system antidote protein VapI